MRTKNRPLAGGQAGGRPCLFSLFRRLTRVNLLLALSVTALADTYNDSFGTATASATLVYNEGTNEVDFTITHNGTTGGSSYAASAQFFLVAGENSDTVVTTVYSNSSAGGNTTSGHVGSTGSKWFMLQFFFTGPSSTSSLKRYWFHGETPPEPDYYADFRIPANEGTEPVKVRFFQAGEVILEMTVQGGAAAQTVHLTAGVTEGLISAVYSYGGYVSTGPDAALVWTEDLTQENAGGGAAVNDLEPPDPYLLLSMRKGTAYTKEPEPVTPTTPETPQADPTPTTAPTAQTPTTAPTRGVVGIPFGSPSGTGGATKEDIEKLGNAVANALDEADTNRQASDDAVLDAVNKGTAATDAQSAAQIAALNALREELVEGRNKSISALNSVNGNLNGIQEDLRKGNASLEQIAVTLGELETNTAPPDSETTASGVSQIISLATDAQTMAQDSALILPETGDVMDDDEDKGSAMPTVLLPGNLTATISLNPLQNTHVQQIASLLRALIGWSVLIGLVSWTYMKIPQWFTEALRGGSGITVWRTVSGAVPLVGLGIFLTLMIAFGTIIFTAPTLLWAYADPLLLGSAGSALVDLREVMLSSGGEDASIMISLLDACCPTGLCVVAFFNWVVLSIGGQSIVAGLIALQKVLTSG